MNVFFLSKDPIVAAQSLCDKHVTAMIHETSQMLTTVMVHYGLKPPLTKGPCDSAWRPMKPTHANHPCCVWLRGSRGNWTWLTTHFEAMLDEFRRRHGHEHRYGSELHGQVYLDATMRMPFPDEEMTVPPQVMPLELRVFSTKLDGPTLTADLDDVVSAYRMFYLRDKAKFAEWRHGPMPYWWSGTEGDRSVFKEPVSFDVETTGFGGPVA